jgi:hypothetical protein
LIDASAPIDLQKSHFSSLDAAAMTRAPSTLPIWIAAVPTPPAAPSTSSVSPALSWARSSRAWCVVP